MLVASDQTKVFQQPSEPDTARVPRVRSAPPVVVVDAAKKKKGDATEADKVRNAARKAEAEKQKCLAEMQTEEGKGGDEDAAMLRCVMLTLCT